jgi:hypothetical protein
MGGESWVYGYDPETKQQSSRWKNPQSQRAKKSAASLEFNTDHAHSFSDMKGTVHPDFVRPNTMLTSYFYCDVLRHLRENVRQKRLEIWLNHNWLIHDSNAPTHTSLKTTESVTNSNTVIVPHPPYSLDLAPMISLCFPNWKLNWRDDILKQRVTSKGNHKRYATAIRKMTSTALLKHGKGWDYCISSQEDYSEGDGSQNWVS